MRSSANVEVAGKKDFEGSFDHKQEEQGGLRSTEGEGCLFIKLRMSRPPLTAAWPKKGSSGSRNQDSWREAWLQDAMRASRSAGRSCVAVRMNRAHRTQRQCMIRLAGGRGWLNDPHCRNGSRRMGNSSTALDQPRQLLLDMTCALELQHAETRIKERTSAPPKLASQGPLDHLSSFSTGPTSIYQRGRRLDKAPQRRMSRPGRSSKPTGAGDMHATRVVESTRPCPCSHRPTSARDIYATR